MKGLTLLLALAVAGCDQAHLVAPETVAHAVASRAPATTTVEALRNVRSLPAAGDYVAFDAVTGERILLAFYNAEEATLSVHSTNEAAPCGSSVDIEPLADRLVEERSGSSPRARHETAFTSVYAPVTPTAFGDFLGDVCLFLDTASPAAQGRTFWAYTYTSYNQSSKATTPYTLTIRGPLLDASGERVHLHLVRQYLVPPSGDPTDVRRVVALGPTMKWTGPLLP